MEKDKVFEEFKVANSALSTFLTLLGGIGFPVLQVRMAYPFPRDSEAHVLPVAHYVAPVEINALGDIEERVVFSITAVDRLPITVIRGNERIECYSVDEWLTCVFRLLLSPDVSDKVLAALEWLKKPLHAISYFAHSMAVSAREARRVQRDMPIMVPIKIIQMDFTGQ